MSFTHQGATAVAAFLASLVECVEALTVVLAVGSVRGWRPALAGAGVAFGTLALVVAVLGNSLERLQASVPLNALQAVVGLLLLLFGLRWLRKAVLRAAGVVPLHDEAAAYEKNRTAALKAGVALGWDKVAFATAFNITMLEGIEVVFIVIALGAGLPAALASASLGALAALLVVIVLGVALHRPLARVPENALKFAVGVLLSAFGTFWAGEGMGLAWPADDWSLAGLFGAYVLATVLLVTRCRSVRASALLRAGVQA